MRACSCREARVGDLQVVPERPVDEALATGGGDKPALHPSRETGHGALRAEHPVELPLVRVVEGRVVAKCLLACLSPLDDVTQLLAQRDREVERGPDALGGQRQAVARRVAAEEDAVLGSAAQLVRDPVALIADRVALEVVGKQHGRVLDVEPRVERPDADPGLLARRERPAVSGRHVAAVDPDLEIVARPGRMDLEPARERGIGRLVAGRGQHATPAERVDHERSRNLAPIGRDRH